MRNRLSGKTKGRKTRWLISPRDAGPTKSEADSRSRWLDPPTRAWFLLLPRSPGRVQGRVSWPEAQPRGEAGQVTPGRTSATRGGVLPPTCWAQSPSLCRPRLPEACLPTPLTGLQKIDFLTAIHQSSTSSCWCDTRVPRASSS